MVPSKRCICLFVLIILLGVVGIDFAKAWPVRGTDSLGRSYAINIILLTNMRLSARAMTRAIITAREAKTAAFQALANGVCTVGNPSVAP